VIEIPGGKKNAASRLIGEVTTHCFASVPRVADGGPDVQVARRVYTRCLSRYQSIGILLAFDQPDDGYTLLRGLMGDAQRLQVMAKHPDERLGRALGWTEEAIRDLEARAVRADRFGEVELADAIRSVTSQQRAALDHVQVELSVSKRIRFPGEGKDLALAAGHPEDELDYIIASDPAHGSLPTSLWHDNRASATSGPDVPVQILVGGNDPAWRARVAGRATRHLVRATAAVADICRQPNASEVAEYAADVERRLDVGDLPELDVH
jgi:hypothetical protein